MHRNAVKGDTMQRTEKPKRKRNTRPEPAPAELELLNDRQAAFELGCGLSKLQELQRDDPDFPAAVWLGTRTKRHLKTEIRDYRTRKRHKPQPQPQRPEAA